MQHTQHTFQKKVKNWYLQKNDFFSDGYDHKKLDKVRCSFWNIGFFLNTVFFAPQCMSLKKEEEIENGFGILQNVIFILLKLMFALYCLFESLNYSYIIVFKKGTRIRRQAQSPLYNHIRPGSLWISAVRALSTPVASKPSSAQYWGCSVPLVHLSQWESKRWQWNIHSNHDAGYIKGAVEFCSSRQWIEDSD